MEIFGLWAIHHFQFEQITIVIEIPSSLLMAKSPSSCRSFWFLPELLIFFRPFLIVKAIQTPQSGWLNSTFSSIVDD
jgi:hypothetical protein